MSIKLSFVLTVFTAVSTLCYTAPNQAQSQAQDQTQKALNCGDATELHHLYPSGAQWSVCASLHPSFGLHLTELHYQAPNGPTRRTFSELHLAGLLEHYHDQSQERSVLSEPGFGSARVSTFTDTSCPGELHTISATSNALCSVSYHDKFLAKYSNKTLVQNHSWDLITTVSDGSDVWEVLVSFGEEGSVTPTLNRSGSVHRFTEDERFGTRTPWSGAESFAVNSTVLATWRIVPGFSDPTNTLSVQQMDFRLRPDLGNRRPMRTEILVTETFRRVERNQFRLWRVFSSDGAGYSIDVQNNGFDFRSRRYNFALFDFAVTAYNGCELLTLGNVSENENCGASLDDYTNGETLDGAIPVMWFSQSMPIVIGSEDNPLMQTRSLSFVLTPFDWTDASPFDSSRDDSSRDDSNRDESSRDQSR